MNDDLKQYMYKVSDYISAEYGGLEQDCNLSDDEKYTVKNIIVSHFQVQDSINNAANNVMAYIKDNRAWMKGNIK